MDILLVSDSQAARPAQMPCTHPENGFLWLDATHDEVIADPEAWHAAVIAATSIRLYELHLKDIINLQHPSYFDSTQDYGLAVFRKLALEHGATEENGTLDTQRKIPPVLAKLATTPVSFVIAERVLITVHAKNSRIIDAAKARMLAYQPSSISYAVRPPASSEELMLRLLNAMVDQYLELRQPLGAQLDRWQRALLNPQRAFDDWMSLLDARNELLKLERMCEEQHDAIQELRDHFVDSYEDRPNGRAKDLLLVRVNDVMEHISRVLDHARRLESSLESAVQIHFASVAHRTNETMRVLTIITALFMPLTLITGIFGMNFVSMPLVNDRSGFWITMGGMGVIFVLGVAAGLVWRARRNKKAP